MRVPPPQFSLKTRGSKFYSQYSQASRMRARSGGVISPEPSEPQAREAGITPPLWAD